MGVGPFDANFLPVTQPAMREFFGDAIQILVREQRRLSAIFDKGIDRDRG